MVSAEAVLRALRALRDGGLVVDRDALNTAYRALKEEASDVS